MATTPGCPLGGVGSLAPDSLRGSEGGVCPAEGVLYPQPSSSLMEVRCHPGFWPSRDLWSLGEADDGREGVTRL